MSDPYTALGLLRNPFVCDDPRALPDHLWLDRDLPHPPASAAGCAVQVIGLRGAGKTALLARWHRETGGVYPLGAPWAGTLAAAPLCPALLLGCGRPRARAPARPCPLAGEAAG